MSTAKHEHCSGITLSLDGFAFSCRVLTSPATSGPPLLIVGGAFQGMDSWRSVANFFLKKGVPVILADLPGAGGSDPLPIDYGLDFLAEAIRVVLDAANAEIVNVASASYGTPLAYAFAAQNQKRVKRLILAGTMKEVPAHMRIRVARTLIPLKAGRMEQFAKEVVEGLLTMNQDAPVHRRELAYRLLRSQLLNMSEVDKIKYELNTLRILSHKPVDLHRPPSCPTLVFTGEYDSFTTPAGCLEVASSIPDSYFTTLNNADHLFNLEKPLVVNQISCEFFEHGKVLSLDDIGPIRHAL